MQRDFSTNVTGWAFLAAALMLWGGWMLLPWKLGTFIAPGDFAPIWRSPVRPRDVQLGINHVDRTASGHEIADDRDCASPTEPIT